MQKAHNWTVVSGPPSYMFCLLRGFAVHKQHALITLRHLQMELDQEFSDWPVGIWCQNDIVLTSMQRNYVTLMVILCYLYVMCQLGADALKALFGCPISYIYYTITRFFCMF